MQTAPVVIGVFLLGIASLLWTARWARAAAAPAPANEKTVPQKKSPSSWYWSHDIKATADHIQSLLLVPGSRLVRFAAYGEEPRQRFATIIYVEPGTSPGTAVHFSLDAAGVQRKLQESAARPISICSYVEKNQRRFCLVTESGPGPSSRAYLDLDEAGMSKLLDGRHAILDFTTYPTVSGRRYAAVVAESTQPSWFVADVDARGLEEKIRLHDARLVSLRGWGEGEGRRYAAVLEKASGRWAWYTGLSGDGVASKLEHHRAYPVDLDPSWDSSGIHYGVVMYAQ